MKSLQHPKIVVLGAGAVGTVLGSLLAHHGADISLIGRETHVAKINQSGVQLAGMMGTFNIKVPAFTRLTFQPDLLFLAVKMTDLAESCRQIAPLVQNVPAVTLQNGVRADEITGEILGKANIISGVVSFNAMFTTPGKVEINRAGGLEIGEPFQENGERVEQIATICRQAIPTRIRSKISGVRWTKLLINCLVNGVEGIAGIPLCDCMASPQLRQFGVMALKEAYTVMKAAQIPLASLPDMPLNSLKFILKTPVPIASQLFKIRASRTSTMTSTLQSLCKGQPTEIDYLNGEIVQLGEELGIPTPYNGKIVALIHETERTGKFAPIHSIQI